MKICLIDYGAGNLPSVANALRALGVEPSIAASPEALAGATHLVLPGVGSFGDCMAQLNSRKLLAPILEWLSAGKPYLGICLGYQILFESSEETPDVAGLGVFSGTVRRFKETPGVKIPHMGWNSALVRKPEAQNWKDLGTEPYFYFVHSYFPVPENSELIATETTYGSDTFASAIERPNLLACQFHPEKSQNAGLRLIGNFLGIKS